MKKQVKKTDFGAIVYFSDDSIPSMEFQYNEPGAFDEFESFWDYAGSRDTFETLEDAIDDYVTYVTES